MYAAAPRLDPRLADAIARLDDSSLPIAETYRRLRDLAEQMGIPRPSYELVRLHIRAARRRQDERRETRDALMDIAFNTRSFDDALKDILR